MTQSEEYGRRLHADERRLAYVALTRARHEALLTYSETNVESRDPRAVGERKQVAKPSNFWQEVYDSMLNIVSRADEPSNLDDIAEVEDGADAVFSGDGISGNDASEMAFPACVRLARHCQADISWASMPAISRMRWSVM